MSSQTNGFTLIELIVVVGIIGLLSVVVAVGTAGIRTKARDTKRRAELSQIGRFIAATSCPIPAAGPGDYDLADLFSEMKAKYPQAGSMQLPTDPKTGTASRTNYHYLVASADKCVLYTNLEKTDEPVTLPSISAPTVGVGTGVFKATANGVNGTALYFQYSR